MIRDKGQFPVDGWTPPSNTKESSTSFPQWPYSANNRFSVWVVVSDFLGEFVKSKINMLTGMIRALSLALGTD